MLRSLVGSEMCIRDRFQNNDPRYFGSLGEAFLSLFRVMTVDQWSEIMYVNIYGCTNEYTPVDAHYCKNPESFGFLAGVYFISFVLIAGVLVLNMMVAAITVSMDTIAQDINKQHLDKTDEHPGEDSSKLLDPEQSRAVDRHKEVLLMLRELEDKIEQQTRDIKQLQHELDT
eukprot:TRINITY_DN12529_c0_g1_i1.p1 TRINITY_DN12529_c0_g1~~TRINITY_DN12529_c0_g1_i1.p1  ORF type:complete len:172 (-),score=53.85 TRINITY_DN12529_c0_g1_i1:483-998(-)